MQQATGSRPYESDNKHVSGVRAQPSCRIVTSPSRRDDRSSTGTADGMQSADTSTVLVPSDYFPLPKLSIAQALLNSEMRYCFCPRDVDESAVTKVRVTVHCLWLLDSLDFA